MCGQNQYKIASWWILPISGCSMLRVNEFQFYELAVAIHPLAAANESSKYREVWLDWSNSAQVLNRTFHVRALEFCLEAATDLYGAIGNVVPHDFQAAIDKYGALPDPEPELGWAAVQPIRQAVLKFETILAAELSNSDTYWISPKGTHKTSMLMRSAHSVLPPYIATRYPSAAADFDEAGRCWLFDNFTASGFHLMRATETVIRDYYAVLTGKPPKQKFRSWAIYIDAMRKCANKNDKVLSFLDHIKDNYRNPISHPEQNLSADDAQILFGVCVSAVSMVAAEIESLTQKGDVLPLIDSSPAER
jgi:hypothetical protein